MNMKYAKYQEFLTQYGIPKTISGIPSLVEFVEYEFDMWNIEQKINKHKKLPPKVTFDFGKHEFGAITSNAQSIQEIKAQIIGAVVDVDHMGRDISQTRLKQFIKHPGSSFMFHFAKGYYLWLLTGNQLGNTQAVNRDGSHLNFTEMWANSYDKNFVRIWDKYIALDKARVWKTLGGV